MLPWADEFDLSLSVLEQLWSDEDDLFVSLDNKFGSGAVEAKERSFGIEFRGRFRPWFS